MKKTIILLIAFLSASLAGSEPALTKSAEYIRRTHNHTTDCKKLMDPYVAAWSDELIHDACSAWWPRSGISEEEFYDLSMAAWTWESGFTQSTTSRIGSRTLSKNKWSYGPTQLTVETANLVLLSWRGMKQKPSAVSWILRRYRGGVSPIDLLNDRELNYWAGTYQLSVMIRAHGIPDGIRAYNSGSRGVRNGLSSEYLGAVQEVLAVRYLWRDGIFFKKKERDDEKGVFAFDSRFFVHRLLRDCSCGNRIP